MTLKGKVLSFRTCNFGKSYQLGIEVDRPSMVDSLVNIKVMSSVIFPPRTDLSLTLLVYNLACLLVIVIFQINSHVLLDNYFLACKVVSCWNVA